MTARDFQTQLANHATIQRTVEALRARNIDALVAESSEEAREKLIRMIPEGAEVFKSTSDTLDTIGYSDYLRQSARYKDLHAAVTAEPDHAQQRELRRLSTVAEYFIGSVHATAETGEVVIAAGRGASSVPMYMGPSMSSGLPVFRKFAQPYQMRLPECADMP
jgi:hypothetical protein